MIHHCFILGLINALGTTFNTDNFAFFAAGPLLMGVRGTALLLMLITRQPAASLQHYN
jgi:hypothetical protein